MNQFVCPYGCTLIKRVGIESASDYVERAYSLFLPKLKFLLDNCKINNKSIQIPEYGEDEDAKYRAFFDHVCGFDKAKGYNLLRVRYSLLILYAVIGHCLKKCSQCSRENGNSKRIILHCTLKNFYVVLQERKDYFLLVTGYPVNPQKRPRL